ncbi:unnamed protein product, partial [Cylicocyclus nassatus]
MLYWITCTGFYGKRTKLRSFLAFPSHLSHSLGKRCTPSFHRLCQLCTALCLSRFRLTSDFSSDPFPAIIEVF